MHIGDFIGHSKQIRVLMVAVGEVSIGIIKNINLRQFEETNQIQKLILYNKEEAWTKTNIQDCKECDILIVLCSSNKEENVEAAIKYGEKFSKDKLTVCICVDNQSACSERINNVFDCDIYTEEKNVSSVLKMILIEMSEGVNGGLNLQSLAEELRHIRKIKYVENIIDINTNDTIERLDEINALSMITQKALKSKKNVKYKAFMYISMQNLTAFHIGQIAKHFKSIFTDIQFQGNDTRSQKLSLKILYGEIEEEYIRGV